MNSMSIMPPAAYFKSQMIALALLVGDGLAHLDARRSR